MPNFTSNWKADVLLENIFLHESNIQAHSHRLRLNDSLKAKDIWIAKHFSHRFMQFYKLYDSLFCGRGGVTVLYVVLDSSWVFLVSLLLPGSSGGSREDLGSQLPASRVCQVLWVPWHSEFSWIIALDRKNLVSK